MKGTATRTSDLSFRRKVDELRRELRVADFGNTLDVKDFDAFQAQLQQLCKIYSRQPLNKLITDYLAPYFDHVKSFEKALTVTFQQDPTASYVWSAALAIIEVRSTTLLSLASH